jgi:broad specificity phosphatase PhoE
MQTEVILIRHGEPRYDEIKERNYVGMGYDLGRLTDLGVTQAENRALDRILKGAEIIVSSPYTRALQTAAIISRITNIPLTVENDLHEWMPDITFKFNFDVSQSYTEFFQFNGKKNGHEKYPWETYEDLKIRVENALEPYKKYNKIIVVCHGIVMSTLTRFDDVIEHCGIRKVFI